MISIVFIKVLIVVIASILAIIGNASYLRDVVKGTIQPHPYTWFIWSIVSATTLLGGIVKGLGIGAIPIGIAEGFTIIIFLFSLKNLFTGHMDHIKQSDHYFLIAALLGLIPWVITKDPTLSIITVVIIDVIAFVPTLKKAYHNPSTEKPALYNMNVARHAMILVSLGSYNIATMLHSVVMICTNSYMAYLIYREK